MNCTIYVCTHKTFYWDLLEYNNIYSIISSRNINNKYNCLEYSFAEIYHLYYIYQNLLDKNEYIGLAQYRKILDIYNNDLETDLQTYDIIVPKPLNFSIDKKNIYTQFISFSSHKLFNSILSIIRELYPEYNNTIDITLNNVECYTYNMFIMSSTNVKKYCEWLFPIIDMFLMKNNFNTYSDIYNYVETHKNEFVHVNSDDKNIHPYFKTIKYSSRFIGMVCERLFNIYIIHNFKNIKEYPIIESGKNQF